MENVLTVDDLKKDNFTNTQSIKSGMKQVTTFFQGAKECLEVVRDITGYDVMEKFKEATGKQKQEQNSNAVQIQAGIEKGISNNPPQIQKSISVKMPDAMAKLEELLKNLDDEKTVKELKEEFKENKSLLEPIVLNFIKGVTFLE